jgi:hypothetical protein
VRTGRWAGCWVGLTQEPFNPRRNSRGCVLCAITTAIRAEVAAKIPFLIFGLTHVNPGKKFPLPPPGAGIGLTLTVRCALPFVAGLAGGAAISHAHLPLGEGASGLTRGQQREASPPPQPQQPRKCNLRRDAHSAGGRLAQAFAREEARGTTARAHTCTARKCLVHSPQVAARCTHGAQPRSAGCKLAGPVRSANTEAQTRSGGQQPAAAPAASSMRQQQRQQQVQVWQQ